MYTLLLSVHIIFGFFSLFIVGIIIYNYLANRIDKQLKRYKWLIYLSIIELLTGLVMQFLSPTSLASICVRFGLYVALIVTALYLVRKQINDKGLAKHQESKPTGF